MIVGRIRGGLKYEDVLAPHIFLDLDENLLVGEPAHGRLADRDLEITGNSLSQHPVGVARKQFHLLFPATPWEFPGVLPCSPNNASDLIGNPGKKHMPARSAL